MKYASDYPHSTDCLPVGEVFPGGIQDAMRVVSNGHLIESLSVGQ